jgi:PE family
MCSYVMAAPEMMAAAATDLAGIGSALSEAHMAAAPPTVGLVPAAADEVSAGVAHLFSRYAADFRGLAGRAAAFHEQFVQHLTAGAFSYTSTEAASASFLQPIVNAIGSLLNDLPEPFTGIGNLFEQSPVNFLLGLLYIPVELLLLLIALPFLPLLLVLAAA